MKFYIEHTGLSTSSLGFTVCLYDTLQAVIEANIIAPLVHLLQNAEFDIKKEAAWAISNATSGGSHEQIKYDLSLYKCLFLFLSSAIS